MKYLFDTNAVIYFLSDNWQLDDFQEEDEFIISFVNKIELLAGDITEEEKALIDNFLESVEVINVDEHIIEKTIEYRKMQKLKVPDAIIMATAEVNGAKLITADNEILKKVKNDWIVNPLSKS